MSYILDALTKAAKQRDREAPVLERLLAPAARTTPAWTRPSAGLLAAVALNAVLLTLLLAVWLRPAPVAVPPVPRPVPPAGVVGDKAAQGAREFVSPGPTRMTVAPPAAAPAGPPAHRPSVVTGPRAPTPAPAPAVTRPVPPAPPETAGLRLEALIYSDLPERRMIFVNGRKYVEGDVIDGRLRVEAIQEDGVVLSERGRRITLRVAR